MLRRHIYEYIYIYIICLYEHTDLSPGARSEHLDVALAFYERVLADGGAALFFCVAGQNRSATLAVAVQVARGAELQLVLVESDLV